MALSIAQLARAAGVSVETVRYYQRRGLLRDPRPSATPGAGIRHYDQQDLTTLRFILAGKDAGFTLAEIGRLQQLDRVDDRATARALAAERVAAIDRDLARLTAARARLSRLVDQCASGQGGSCPIIATLAG